MAEEKEEDEPSPPKTRGGKEPAPACAAARSARTPRRAREGVAQKARDAEDEEEKDGDAKDGATRLVSKDGDTKASDAPSSTASPASPFPEPNRPGSLSVKETVLFLSKLAHLTRLGREVTQTTEMGGEAARDAARAVRVRGVQNEPRRPTPRSRRCARRCSRKSSATTCWVCARGTPSCARSSSQVVEQRRRGWPKPVPPVTVRARGAGVGRHGGHALAQARAGPDPQHARRGRTRHARAQQRACRRSSPNARARRRGARRQKRALAAASDPKSGGPPPPPPPPRPVGRDAPKRPNEKTKAMLDRHAAFVHREASLRVANLVGPLREVATRNAHVAYYLWVLVFPIVWATLRREEQMQLAKPMIALLSKEYHQRQAAVRPNVVQALLEGISLSQPRPRSRPSSSSSSAKPTTRGTSPSRSWRTTSCGTRRKRGASTRSPSCTGSWASRTCSWACGARDATAR